MMVPPSVAWRGRSPPELIRVLCGSMRPSQLIALKLGQSRMAVVAAPAYLARRGVPQTPYDLDAHNCIAFSFARYVDEWSFIVDRAHVSLPARGNDAASDVEISRRLALAGQGFARLSLFHIKPDINAGRLVPVLEAYNPGDVEELNVFYVGHGGRLQARVRAFIDFLVDEVHLDDPPELVDTI